MLRPRERSRGRPAETDCRNAARELRSHGIAAPSRLVPEAGPALHSRDKQQREVDILLERHSGEVIGIEAKASATLSSGDFAGLRYLRGKLGPRFKAGAVLHTGADTSPVRRSPRSSSGQWNLELSALRHHQHGARPLRRPNLCDQAE